MTAATTTAATTTAALPAPPPIRATRRLRLLITDSLVIARRSLSHIRQIPEKLVDVTLQPLMFMILFALVFGNVIAIPGGDYHEYLVAGILVQTLAFGTFGPGTSIASDLTEGIIDRFRTLPISRLAFLLGHLLAELAGMAIAITVLTVSALFVGWGIHTDVLHAAGAYALLMTIALTMVSLGLMLGVLVRSVDAVMGVAFIGIFPLTFLAGTFVPVGSLPDGLRQIAEWNPISAFAAALRHLFGNPEALTSAVPWSLAHPVLCSLLWCAALLAIAVPVTIRGFNARTRD